MGNSNWNHDFYQDRQTARKKSGQDAFAHHQAVATGKTETATHPKMNPKDVLRESRDSAAHPNSIAIKVMLDVTGSMNHIPRLVQDNLHKLNDDLKPVIDDPQILFGAVGDAKCDRGPLQVGQFESGIEMDDDLTRFYLEGNGGGNGGESYELAIYFAARHTATDCFEKRQKRGYIFLIGDELPHRWVEPDEVASLMGDKIPDRIPVEDIVKEAQVKWNIFFMIPEGSSHASEPTLLNRWAGLLGRENVLFFNPSNSAEVIARQIGICEGKVKKSDAPRAGVTLL